MCGKFDGLDQLVLALVYLSLTLLNLLREVIHAFLKHSQLLSLLLPRFQPGQSLPLTLLRFIGPVIQRHPSIVLRPRLVVCLLLAPMLLGVGLVEASDECGWGEN